MTKDMNVDSRKFVSLSVVYRADSCVREFWAVDQWNDVWFCQTEMFGPTEWERWPLPRLPDRK